MKRRARTTGKPRFEADRDGGSGRYALERLEERILFSADGALLGVAHDPTSAFERAYPTPLADAIVTDRTDERSVGRAEERAAERARVELIVVDAAVFDAEKLAGRLRAEAPDGTYVYLLEPDEGLERIGDLLGEHEGVDALHLVTHGEEGRLRLGAESLGTTDLLENAGTLSGWGEHLGDDADILLYGCDLAGGAEGVRFVQTLSDLTGADVAASDDATGHRALGGDWQLEHARGAIETAVFASEAVQEDWTGLLARVVRVAHEAGSDDFEIKAGGAVGGQTFAHTSGNGTYTVNEVDLLLRREAGAPAQTLTVTLRDSFGGAVLGSATLDAASLGTSPAWQTFTLSNDVGLDDGIQYVLQIETSAGGLKVHAGMDKDAGYLDGDLLQANGSVDTGNDLQFRLALEDPSILETTIAATQDAYIELANPNANHGSDTTLFIDREDGDLQRVLVGFDLSSLPAGATIEAASLELAVTDVGGEMGIEARQILESWDEGSVTWNERDAGVAWSTPFGGTAYGSKVIDSGSIGTVSLDITDLARDWYSGAEASNGVMVGSFDGGGDRLTDVTSREGGSGPVLRIAYTLPPNTDPTITSPATFSIDENTTAVGTVTATDADGDTPAYSITGGADAALFSIDVSSGVLTFDAAPDFETPADAGVDNVYDVVVDVSDGSGGTASQAIAVTVIDVNESLTRVVYVGDETQDSEYNILSGSPIGQTFTHTDGSGSYTVSEIDLLLRKVDADPQTLTVTLRDSWDGTVLGTATIGTSDLTGTLAWRTLSFADVELTDGVQYVVQMTSNNGDGGIRVGLDTTNGYPDGDRINSDGSIDSGTDINFRIAHEPPPNTPPVISSSSMFSVGENVTAVGTVVANDSDGDLPVYSIGGGADAALFSIDASSGALTFDAAPDFETPADAGGDNVYDVIVHASDGNGGTDAQAIAVTVDDVNEAPVITSAAAVSVDENQTGVTTVTATDPDAGATQTYSLTGGADQGAFAINSSTGVLSFIAAPDHETQGSYEVEVTVSDGTLTDSQVLTVPVDDVNEAPVLGAIDDQSADEGSTLSFTASASDSDDPADTLSYSLDAASLALGMTIDANTGAFSWTPGESQGGTAPSVTVTVTDDGTGTLSDSETFTVTVSDVNSAPVLAAIGDQSVDEGSTLTFTASATDSDDPADNLTYTLDAASVARGMTIDSSTGAFSWTPDESQGGTAPSVTVTVTDDGTGTLSDSETFTVTVADVNSAPVLAAIGDQSVDEGSTLTFTASATDSDDPADTLSYSLDAASVARGMTIDSSTGAFSWTPDESQGGTAPSVTVTVTDSGTGALTDSETFTVTVADVNSAPVLAAIGDQSVDENATLSFTASASDSDDPSDTLSYSLDAASLALGMTIDSSTGAFSWTPDESQGGTTPVVTVTVTDPGTGALTDSETFTVTVADVNSAPVLAAIGDQSVDEGSTLTFTASASDSDDPTDTLSYSLDAASLALGMTINSSTGAFSWTPDESQGGTTPAVTVTVTDSGTGALTDSETFTVTVADVNSAPVLAAIGDQSVDEGLTLTFTASATDSDDPSDTLSYSLDAASVARGMTIDSSTGAFSWTPDESQGGTTPAVTVTVTDSGTGTLSDSETFTVTVSDVNSAPVLAAIGGQSVDEGSTLMFTASASDSDDPSDTLSYSLDAASVARGMTIDANTGAFSWTPGESQGGTAPSVTITVTDDGTGTLTDSETFTVTVAGVNSAPVLAAIGDQSVDEGSTLSFTAGATDSDDPSDTLTYSLDAASLALGMTIDSSTGAFSWTPDESQGGTDAVGDGHRDRRWHRDADRQRDVHGHGGRRQQRPGPRRDRRSVSRRGLDADVHGQRHRQRRSNGHPDVQPRRRLGRPRDDDQREHRSVQLDSGREPGRDDAVGDRHRDGLGHGRADRQRDVHGHGGRCQQRPRPRRDRRSVGRRGLDVDVHGQRHGQRRSRGQPDVHPRRGLGGAGDDDRREHRSVQLDPGREPGRHRRRR